MTLKNRRLHKAKKYFANLRGFSRRTLFIAGLMILAGLCVGAYFALQRPARVPMIRFAPARSLAFAEVYSLGDVVDGLTSTRAWRELAPPLGLSNQYREIGQLVDILGRTGWGPEEAVIAGRAQFGLAVTGLDADAGSSDDGPYVHFKPHFALVVETHSGPAAADRVARNRVSVLARRIFGNSVIEEADRYQGIDIHIFHGDEAGRQMLAAATSSLVLVANDRSALESSLDTIAGRAPSLADDQILANYRSVVDQRASVFGYLTAAGIDKLSAIGPAIISARFTTDPDRVDSIASLFRHISAQALSGMLYSAEFTPEGVTDRYLTVASPRIASGLNEAFKAPAGADQDCLLFVPHAADDFTVLNIEGIGGLPERALKRVSPGLDVVGGLALREFVIGLFGQLGVSSPDMVRKGFGDRMVLVKFNQSSPVGIIAEVGDRQSLAGYLSSYLEYKGANTSTENYKGVDISLSSAQDGRAAALTGRYLLLGTRAQIGQMIDAQGGVGATSPAPSNEQLGCYGSFSSIGRDVQIVRALSRNGAPAPIITCTPCPSDAARFMLAVSKLARTTDGSPQILEQDEAKRALALMPPSVSFTEFREIGVYTETRSAIGNLGLAASPNAEE